MAKTRTLLKDEHLSPQTQCDMNFSKFTNIALESGLKPWSFDQRLKWKPLFHPNILFFNRVHVTELISVTSAFILCHLADRRLRDMLQMNPKTPAVP